MADRSIRLGIHRDTKTILYESLVVGVLFLVIYAAVAAMTGGSSGLPLWEATLVAFAAAVLGHWTFEASGLNEYFCKYTQPQYGM